MKARLTKFVTYDYTPNTEITGSSTCHHLVETFPATYLVDIVDCDYGVNNFVFSYKNKWYPMKSDEFTIIEEDTPPEIEPMEREKLFGLIQSANNIKIYQKVDRTTGEIVINLVMVFSETCRNGYTIMERVGLIRDFLTELKSQNKLFPIVDVVTLDD